jgi:hypothetical protein
MLILNIIFHKHFLSDSGLKCCAIYFMLSYCSDCFGYHACGSKASQHALPSLPQRYPNNNRVSKSVLCSCCLCYYVLAGVSSYDVGIVCYRHKCVVKVEQFVFDVTSFNRSLYTIKQVMHLSTGNYLEH